MTILNNLQPTSLWQYFEAITKIPRPSKKEEKIISFLIEFAKLNNLELKKDDVGNLLMFKPASNSKRNSPTVVLQSHVDMVCEKNASKIHDFTKDPLDVYIEGEWVKADGTTLGADDGIGIAAMLAILSDSSLEHGPLECLFTVDEETGLTGAFELSAGFFKGKTLINLDSEDEGELFIGCAGGIDTSAIFDFSCQPVFENYKSYQISVTGLQGGHSGDEIHKGRGNAIKIITNFLSEAFEKTGAELHRLEGGNLKNAIPREAFATVLLPPAMEKQFLSLCHSYLGKTHQELLQTEPSYSFATAPVPTPETKLEKEFANRLINALSDCPHGVISWSRDIDDLVETSTNLASIKFISDKQVLVTTSQRSSVETEKHSIAQRVEAIFSAAGAKVSHSKGYPGWTPNLQSQLLQITSNVYFDLFKEKAKIKAIHAGLECGLFLEKYPGLDMISFGPTIKGAHSPDERLHIPSVDKFWKLLLNVLQQI
jgi:dipeptidase D